MTVAPQISKFSRSPEVLIVFAIVQSIIFLALVPLRNSDDRHALDKRLKQLRKNETQQEPLCLTPECIRLEAEGLSRAFPDRVDGLWCVSKNATNTSSVFVDNLNRYQGLLLVKVPKVASSTSAGVAFRISRRRHCDALQWEHRLGAHYTNRAPTSFLFTTVRDPGSRAISSLFFHVISRNNSTATDELVIGKLRESKMSHYGAQSDGQGGFQLRYTAMDDIPVDAFYDRDHPNQVLNLEQVKTLVRKTIASYDFILVPERMDESLVAMGLVMGIDVGDVLVTASKVAGSQYHLAKPAGKSITCLPSIKSFVSPRVAEFLAQDEWRAANYGDYLLYSAAHHSLNKTIERIGSDRFDAALSEYLRFKMMEGKLCAPQVIFPCSDEGVPQPELSRKSCYLRNHDFGCGYKCIDEMLAAERK